MGYEIFIVTLSISLLMYIFFVPRLSRNHLSQTVRIEGPSSHYIKNGTPTFGGVIFVFSTVLIYLFYALLYSYDYLNLLLYFFPLLFYSLIGFIDDGLIVKLGKNNGLAPKTKVVFQILGGVIYCVILKILNHSTEIVMFNKIYDLKFGYYVLVVIMLLSTSNAINLTDGIDGLAGGCFVISMFFVIMMSIKADDQSLLSYSIIISSSVLAYLCFNYHKAKIFMGDSGSLALGAALSSMFIILKMEVLLIIVGIIFIIETFSVIIQVLYFKITKGKRLFKMTPIHHHFEFVGLSETKIDYLFWIVELLGVLIALYLGFNYY